jgi:hypothetical protein
MQAGQHRELTSSEGAFVTGDSRPVSLPSGQRFTSLDMIVSFTSGVLLLLLSTPAAAYRAAMQGGSVNPDSLMRLVRLREMLAAGKMLDLVPRDGSGAGIVIYWSHLVDLLVLILGAPLRLAVGWNRALGDVALVFGPLSFGALCVASAWAVAPLTRRPWRYLSPLILVASPAIFSYAMPGVIHHHVLLLLCAVMIAGCTGRVLCEGQGEVSIGIWCGIGLWISPEIMPFALFAFGMLYLDWLRRPTASAGTAIRNAGATMLCVATIALFIDPPQAGMFSSTIDRLSIPFIVMCLACWMSGWILSVGAGRLRPKLVAVLAILPLLGWLLLFPAVAEGPASLMSSEQAKAFFGNIEEMRRVSSLQDALRFLWCGLLALITVLMISRRRQHFPWLCIAALAAVCLALGWWHVRFAAYAGVLGAMALPVAMTSSAQPSSRLAPGTVFLVFIIGPALCSLLAVGHRPAPNPCAAPPSMELLASATNEVVLASPNLTPDLLYRSDVLTVGSLFHRGIAAFMRQRAAWRSRLSVVVEPESVIATRARWVLACHGAGRDALVRGLPYGTLEDGLAAGTPPPWLNLAGSDGNWRLWAVR